MSWPIPDLSGADDLTLAQRAGLGDRRAFAAIVGRHGPAMFRFARRVLLDDGDAEEAVQDALVAAWQHVADFRAESTLRTWLFGISLSKAHNISRKRRPAPMERDDSVTAGPGSNPETGVMENQFVAAVDHALATLPEQQRIAWILREVDELSYAEIAEITHSSRDVVRGRLQLARRTLAERLAPWR